MPRFHGRGDFPVLGQLRDLPVVLRLVQGAMGENAVNLGCFHQLAHGSAPRVSADNEAHWEVGLKASIFDSLHPDHSVPQAL